MSVGDDVRLSEADLLAMIGLRTAELEIANRRILLKDQALAEVTAERDALREEVASHKKK